MANIVAAAHLPHFESFGTVAIHAGQEPEKNENWAVIPPISMSSTFKQPEAGITKGEFDYSRAGNPTRHALEEALAGITGAKYGFAFASGLAGTVAIMSLLKSGDHVIAMNDLYGGTNRLFRTTLSKFGLEFSFVDARNPDNIAKAMRTSTKLVWIETPSNPLLSISDIRAVAAVAHRYKTLLVVDNTFMSPYFQRPLSLGADIEFASCTKYINGHSDAVMGMASTNDPEIAKQLKFQQLASGGIPSPFDCFLVNRGIKTLHRLVSHPGHEIAKKQCSGFSGMVSFRIKGALAEAKTFLAQLKVFTLAESLGGVESLAELPAIMTHASIAKPEREALGVTDSLLRLSCGVETTIDLLLDIQQALKAAVPGPDGPDPVRILSEVKCVTAAESIQNAVRAADSHDSQYPDAAPAATVHPAVQPKATDATGEDSEVVLGSNSASPLRRNAVPAGRPSTAQLPTSPSYRQPPGGHSQISFG